VRSIPSKLLNFEWEFQNQTYMVKKKVFVWYVTLHPANSPTIYGYTHLNTVLEADFNGKTDATQSPEATTQKH